MNYLRSLLPPNTPANSSSRPTLDQRLSEDSAHLTPPPRSDFDDTDPLPFIPPDNDTTSLNQLDPGAPRLDFGLNPKPRVFKHHSYTSASSSEAVGDTSRSVPATPAVKSRTQSPRRRNSVPAKRFYESTKTLVNSPETRPLHQRAFDPNADDIAPEEIVLVDATSGSMPSSRVRSRRATTASGVIQDWLSSTEQLRSPCLEHMDQLPRGVLTLPPDAEPLPSFDDASDDTIHHDQPEPDMLDDFEGFAGTQQLERAETAPSLLIPLEIRLRRASKEKEKELQLRRRSLPFLKQLTLPVHQPTSTAEVLGRISLPELLSQKSASAAPALTHAWTNRYLQSPTADRPDDTIRRISSTLQIVHLRDSVYEVIWEDNLAAGSANESRRVSSTDFGLSAPIHPLDSNKYDFDRVDTTMAAWHWSANATQSPSPSPAPSSRHLGGRRSSQPALFRNDSVESSEPSMQAAQSADSSEIPGNSLPMVSGKKAVEDDMLTNTKSDAESNSPQSARPVRRTSIQQVVDAKNRTPSPVAHIAPSAISGKQRRELLGNRKVSDFSNADDHFAGHRDSLVLAHKRIFHEQIDKIEKALHSDEASDPRVDLLKNETWHMRRASVGSSSLGSSLTSAGEPAEHAQTTEKAKGKAVGILVHEDDNGKRYRIEKHIHLKGVDE